MNEENSLPFDAFVQIAVNYRRLRDAEKWLTSAERLEKTIEQCAMDIPKGTRIFAAIRKRSRFKLVVNR